MVSFENFVKSMPPSLSELKVTPSFCFPLKIFDDTTTTIMYISSKSEKKSFFASGITIIIFSLLAEMEEHGI